MRAIHIPAPAKSSTALICPGCHLRRTAKEFEARPGVYVHCANCRAKGKERRKR